MQLNIITIDRSPRPNYLRETLESLRASDWNPVDIPLTLCVGNDQEAYLQSFGYDVLSWNGPAFETPWISFVDNYTRALRHGEGNLIVCEDDLRFTSRWLERLQGAVQELDRKLSRYVLALYAPVHPGRKWFCRGLRYRPYKTSRFHGTQAMYFPASVRIAVADYLESNRRRRPGDLLIGEWCGKWRNRNLYMLQGSIVQHVGSVSTGLGSGQHRAWNLLA